jgi:hypothetical protein
MKGMIILERIVAEEGNCCWATPTVCHHCPLGRLIRSDNGKYMSCVEALAIDGLSEEEADAVYKKAALDKLADVLFDNIIESD